MISIERLTKYRSLLSIHRAISASELCARQEMPPATLRRDRACLRDERGWPIRFDRERGGYILTGAIGDLDVPGLWFRTDELQALLALRHLVVQIDPGGLLAAHLAPLKQWLDKALRASGQTAAAIEQRVRILAMAARRIEPQHFQTVGQALLRRRRLAITYYNRQRGDRSERKVSPQRVVHYRDNWYLDAWCHQREALRTFSVDAIESAQALEEAAIDIPDAQLDEELGAGFGIFSGRSVKWAKLRFSPERSRWVSAERWHPEQRGRWDRQGRWVLEVPYSDPRELVMDILRHVPEVEVMGPASLKWEVATRLESAAKGTTGEQKPSVSRDRPIKEPSESRTKKTDSYDR